VIDEFSNLVNQRIGSIKSGLVHPQGLLERDVAQILLRAAASDQEPEVFLRFSISLRTFSSSAVRASGHIH
jgi:hypothetical protein